ncbi:conserved hypothetical protein [Trichophyton verrucosum HKI 0517]|uniref:Uncharacterized protein n=1 Tax=Trichophyton verrucosum (strain HKI 0517) TaxID=663202 RepID=D4DCY8_TRIVH|nr:uncharacterized protein TRV_04994 [Trichophyton verrucosum HKI 0517]EFE40300.1 conserved hypothetical protein [Trichophyton verrucosum HKI 0517]
MSHTTSKTWVSEETREYEAWIRVRDSMSYVAPRSPFVPTTFKEWLVLRLLKKMEDKHKIAQSLAIKQQKLSKTATKTDKLFRGRRLRDRLGLVLAAETIWGPLSDPGSGRQNAYWPSRDEFKHEGDDRCRSGYSRFPPLPRVLANETVNWKQRKPIAQYEFDKVGKVKTKDDNHATEISIAIAVRYIGKSFIRDLDFGKI